MAKATRAAALLRVSTGEQTTDPQRREIEAWAQREGASLRFYAEEAVSGAARSRPVLDRLLGDARRGRFDVLVVAALDRIGRDVVRIVLVLDDLQAAGVRVVSLREGLDFGGPMGRAMAALLGAIAEIERAAIRERVRSGIAAARRRGVRLGRPRLEWTAEEVAEVRALLAAGRSVRGIAREGLVKVFDSQGVARVPSEGAIRGALRGDGGGGA